MNDTLYFNATCPTGTQLVAHRRCGINSSGELVYASATSTAIGTLMQDVDGDAPSRNRGALLSPAAALSFATYGSATALSKGDEIQAAANGKVDKLTNGRAIGVAIETAAADGDVIRVVYYTSADAGGGAVGYNTGAGGAVTQITSASTGVTLSKLCGQITTVALTTAGAAEEVFTVTNTLVAATDTITFGTTYAGAGTPMISAKAVAAGSFDIVITNLSASALNALMVINFAIVKAVAA